MMGFNVGQRVEHLKTGAEGTVIEVNPRKGAYGAADVLWDGGDRTLRISYVDLAPASAATSFEQSVNRITSDIAKLLIEKNKQYSNSALDPIRVFSKADRMEQLRVRADDKLSRIRNGDSSEDAVMDLAGYLVLMKIAQESE